MAEPIKPLTCARVCNGDAGSLNLVLWPFVLVYNALNLYVFPCFGILLTRLLLCIARPLAQLWGCWTFTDKEWCGQRAIGNTDAIEWIRADQLASQKDGEPMKMKLFEDGVTPADLVQGAVGDCWLIAAFASAAEHPACIRNAFDTRERSPRGKYRVRLYDGHTRRWTHVTIDDTIPVKKGTSTPAYGKPQGDELWAILLEKAIAKFCGSYEALDGGWALWGWHVLTGDHVFRLSTSNGKTWKRLDFKPAPQPKDKRDFDFYTTEEVYTADQAWVLIQKYILAGSLCAASGGKDMSGQSASPPPCHGPLASASPEVPHWALRPRPPPSTAPVLWARRRHGRKERPWAKRRGRGRQWAGWLPCILNP
jgi:hypothetical protein